MLGGYRPVEISVGVLMGVLMTLLLLGILLPGLCCLYKIQTPSTFEVVDRTDAKKKMN